MGFSIMATWDVELEQDVSVGQ